jgi:hypothetical protein
MHNGVIEVLFPEILNVAKEVTFPANSFKCQILVSISLLRLRDGLVLRRSENESLEFNKSSKKLDAQLLKFTVPGGCLCIIKMSVQFCIAGRIDWQKMIRFD